MSPQWLHGQFNLLLIGVIIRRGFWGAEQVASHLDWAPLGSDGEWLENGFFTAVFIQEWCIWGMAGPFPFQLSPVCSNDTAIHQVPVPKFMTSEAIARALPPPRSSHPGPETQSWTGTAGWEIRQWRPHWPVLSPVLGWMFQNWFPPLFSCTAKAGFILLFLNYFLIQ